MKSRRVLLYAAVAIATFAMLLPVIHSVNLFRNNLSGSVSIANHPDGNALFPGTAGDSLVADGNPFPPLPPEQANGELVADGNPFPPLPPANTSQVLVADGNPFPPLPPEQATGELVADGNPFPPLPPNSDMGLRVTA